MATKIIQRRDTAANWTSANPVLDAGEFGVETDTGLFKVGNGTDAWTVLGYAAEEAKVLLIENGATVPPGTPVGTLVFEKAAAV